MQSPQLTTGKGRSHQVEGIGVGFEPPFLNKSVLSEIRAIDQEKRVAMSRQLANEDGIFCGASTGLNIGPRVVTFACDSGLKYLGGHVYLKKN